MIYILIHLFTLLKFTIYFFILLFQVEYFTVKIFCIFFFLLIIYILKKYPRTRFHKLSALRNYKLNLIMKFALKSKTQQIYNYFILFVFFLFSFVLVFYLRYLNKARVILLQEKYIEISNTIMKASIWEIIGNSLLFILLFIIYIILIIKLTEYFKFHVIKRHLYLIGGLDNSSDFSKWYELKFFHEFLYKINIYSILFNINQKFIEIYRDYYYNKRKHLKYKKFNIIEGKEEDLFHSQKPYHPYIFMSIYKKDRILYHIVTKWHYTLLFCLFCYDLIYNNYQISLIFSILPWILFYDIYLRMSKFINNLWLPHDQYLHTILYCNSIEIWNENTLIIDGDFYDYSHIKMIYQTYIKREFVKDINYI